MRIGVFLKIKIKNGVKFEITKNIKIKIKNKNKTIKAYNLGFNLVIMFSIILWNNLVIMF